MTNNQSATFELRTYTILPGKLPDVMLLFREHLVKLLGKHGMSSVAYFTPNDEDDKLIYIVAHDRAANVQKNWDDFHADEEWTAAIKAVEKGVRFVTDVQSVVLSPTDFSPIYDAPSNVEAGDSREERNKKAALAFIDEFFNQKDFSAADRYLSPGYIQHNPTIADGIAPLVEFGSQVLAGKPELSFENKRAVAEGDFVYLHGHLKFDAADAGNAVADIYRFDESGKIVEHWDILQPVPAEAKNDNTMF